MSDNHDLPDNDSGSTPVVSGDNKSANAFPSISRDVTDEDLKESAGARKLLLRDYDRLSEENNELKRYKDNFHSVDKNEAILIEVIKGFKSQRILSDVAKMFGSIIIGLIPSMAEKSALWLTIVMSIVATLIIAAAFLSDYICKKNHSEVK